MNLVQILCWLAFCTLTIGAAPAPMNQQKKRRSRYAALLHDFGAFKRKLQHSGLINSIDDDDSGSSDGIDATADGRPASPHARLNEMDMLQLIPVLIDELQAGHIDAGEQRMLHSLFGTLWELMQDEVAARRQASAGDPVLGDLLRALQRLEANGGRLPAVGGRNGSGAVVKKDARFVNLWNRGEGGGADEEPAQRMLKLVAILIHANRGSE